ncbi:gluconate 2-dehydrogenase subunit 3 family protein [Spirosoma aerophilum]
MKPNSSISTESIPRREALQRLALLVGGTLSLSVQAALGGEFRNDNPIRFSADQQTLVANLVDIIIPPTNTPGAREAGVDQFIDYVIGHCSAASQQELFLRGLQQTEQRSQAAFGKPFGELTTPQRIELVGQLAQQEKPFFLSLRELTIVGYFTSEMGATKALDYIAIPGRFQGDIPLTSTQKSWAI